jgi:glyoxylase-like metal-dependent hydrolase (beta-lactamase superfamily II)
VQKWNVLIGCIKPKATFLFSFLCSSGSLSSVRALLIPKIIPGHGPVAGKDALQKQALYLEDLHKEVGAAIAKSFPLEEVQKAITMEAYKDLKWPDLLVPDVSEVYQELKAEKNK